MRVGRAAALASGFLLLITATLAASQTEPEFPQGKPVNLKVLPKDITAADLGKQMKRSRWFRTSIPSISHNSAATAATRCR